MNINQFKIVKSTVDSVNPTNTGMEIWVQHEDGREAAYRVNDPKFAAREGQQMTAILYGVHPVAVLNNSTNIKIQLLNGWDLLGTGPEVKSRSGIFWVLWAIFMIPFTMCVAGTIIDNPHDFFGKSGLAPYVANLVGGLVALLPLFGIPIWCIILPRFKRHQHLRLVKGADAAIAKLFNPL